MWCRLSLTLSCRPRSPVCTTSTSSWSRFWCTSLPLKTPQLLQLGTQKSCLKPSLAFRLRTKYSWLAASLKKMRLELWLQTIRFCLTSKLTKWRGERQWSSVNVVTNWLTSTGDLSTRPKTTFMRWAANTQMTLHVKQKSTTFQKISGLRLENWIMDAISTLCALWTRATCTSWLAGTVRLRLL